jgi:hypothetical protein
MATLEVTSRVNTGTVTGTVTASPALHSYVGVRVALVRRSTSRVVGTPSNSPVAADGTFRITHVPVGRWVLLCIPVMNLPLACVTYPSLTGLDLQDGAAIKVTAGSRHRVHLELPSAGYVQVFVTDSQTGEPLPGATVLGYETSKRKAFAVPPTMTDASGQVLLSNMPLRSRVIVLGPTGYGTRRVVGPDGSSLLKIPKRGGLVTLNATVDPQ